MMLLTACNSCNYGVNDQPTIMLLFDAFVNISIAIALQLARNFAELAQFTL